MIDQHAASLTRALDALIEAHGGLLSLARAQREPIARGDAAEVDRIARQVEVQLAHALACEDARQNAAIALAAAADAPAARWSMLAGALPDALRNDIQERITRLEGTVRELELANAVNAGLCAQELALVDHSLRAVLSQADVHRGYSATGGDAPSAPMAPVLINQVA